MADLGEADIPAPASVRAEGAEAPAVAAAAGAEASYPQAVRGAVAGRAPIAERQVPELPRIPQGRSWAAASSVEPRQPWTEATAERVPVEAPLGGQRTRTAVTRVAAPLRPEQVAVEAEVEMARSSHRGSPAEPMAVAYAIECARAPSPRCLPWRLPRAWREAGGHRLGCVAGPEWPPRTSAPGRATFERPHFFLRRRWPPEQSRR